MAKYSDKFKAGALVILETEGYPDDKYALKRVADHLKMPVRTLRRWAKGSYGAPPDSVVQEQKKNMIDVIDEEIRAAFEEMHHARGDATYRDLVIGAATLLDKKQLLSGEPTERIKQDVDVSDSRERFAHLIDRHVTRKRAGGDHERTH